MKNCKSIMKKITAMAVALVMCVTMLPGAVLADGTETVYIGTATEYVAFVNEFNEGQHAGCNVTLTNNINLGGQAIAPIGDWDNPFTGTFDGDNKTISYATISGFGNWDVAGSVIRAGLIGCVNGGTVQNLTLDNIAVTNSSTSNSSAYDEDEKESATGAAVGTLRSGTISGVHVTSSCTVSGHLRTGGIVGDARGTSSVVTGCTNAATVNSDNLYTGGIVGAAHDVSGAQTATGTAITGCCNMGNVTGTTNVGGIVGYADRAIVTNCDNGAENTTSPTITGTGNYGTGGIMGANVYNYIGLPGLFSASSSINTCHNYGSIVGGRAGGILGAYISAPGKSQPLRLLNCTIKNCTNYGAVTGTAGKSGAIFGYQISYAQGDGESNVNKMGVLIQGCTYSCTVNGVTATVATPSTISITIS